MRARVENYTIAAVAGDISAGFNLVYSPSTGWEYTTGSLVYPEIQEDPTWGLDLLALAVEDIYDPAGTPVWKRGQQLDLLLFGEARRSHIKIPMQPGLWGGPVHLKGRYPIPYGFGLVFQPYWVAAATDQVRVAMEVERA